MRASIHAPARGATGRHFAGSIAIFASIHAPARGATSPRQRAYPGPRCFNPRSRTGSDLNAVGPGRLDMLLQSTLPHGERPVQWAVFLLGESFNPRSRTGSDRARVQTSACSRRLQSTLPHGERRATVRFRGFRCGLQSTLPHGERRPADVRVVPAGCGFNPRSRMGSDVDEGLHAQRQLASIHAPARGATRARAATSSATTRFNPRSRTGSDAMSGAVR